MAVINNFLDNLSLNDKLLVLHPKSKTSVPPPEYSLEIANVTYTQLMSHVLTQNDFQRTGVNRDFSVAKKLSDSFAIACVCDGAAMRYWSQIAATMMGIKYIENLEKELGMNKPYSPEDDNMTLEELKSRMVNALIATNMEVINYRDKDGVNAEIDLKGGQTTFVACVVFRVVPKSPIYGFLKRLQRKREEYGVCVLSMGDSAASKLTLAPNPIPSSTKQLWEVLTDNIGMMLPEISLHKGQIPEIRSFPIVPESQVICCYTDGLIDSFPPGAKPHKRYPCFWVGSGPVDVESISHSLLQEIDTSHSKNQTHPDDVSVVIIGFKHQNYTSASTPTLHSNNNNNNNNVDNYNNIAPKTPEAISAIVPHKITGFVNNNAECYRHFETLPSNNSNSSNGSASGGRSQSSNSNHHHHHHNHHNNNSNNNHSSSGGGGGSNNQQGMIYPIDFTLFFNPEMKSVSLNFFDQTLHYGHSQPINDIDSHSFSGSAASFPVTTKHNKKKNINTTNNRDLPTTTNNNNNGDDEKMNNYNNNNKEEDARNIINQKFGTTKVIGTDGLIE